MECCLTTVRQLHLNHAPGALLLLTSASRIRTRLAKSYSDFARGSCSPVNSRRLSRLALANFRIAVIRPARHTLHVHGNKQLIAPILSWSVRSGHARIW